MMKGKTLSLIFVGIVALGLIYSSTDAVGQSSTEGTVEILAATCGINLLSSTIDFTSLIPGIISSDVSLTVQNTGTAPAQLDISGSDWQNTVGPPITQMLVSETHYNVTAGIDYGLMSTLSTTDTPIPVPFVPGDIDLFFKVQANLIDPFFVGPIQQTIDLTTSCP